MVRVGLTHGDTGQPPTVVEVERAPDGFLVGLVSKIARTLRLDVDDLNVYANDGSECEVRGDDIHTTSSDLHVDGTPSLLQQVSKSTPTPRNSIPKSRPQFKARRKANSSTSAHVHKPILEDQPRVPSNSEARGPSLEKYEKTAWNDAHTLLVKKVYPLRLIGEGNGNKRKNFKKNMARRFKIEGGKLYAKRREGRHNPGEMQTPTFARSFTTTNNEWRQVLTADEAVEMIRARHNRAHDGARRMRDISDRFLIHEVTEKINQVRVPPLDC